jgi:hypothetical protein
MRIRGQRAGRRGYSPTAGPYLNEEAATLEALIGDKLRELDYPVADGP